MELTAFKRAFERREKLGQALSWARNAADLKKSAAFSESVARAVADELGLAVDWSTPDVAVKWIEVEFQSAMEAAHKESGGGG